MALELFDKDGKPVSLEAIAEELNLVKDGIPQSRFSEVNQKRKDAERSVITLQERIDELETEKAKKSGDLQTLVDRQREQIVELTSASDRLKVLETLVGDSVEKRIQTLPEKLRTLVPEGTADQKFSWLSKNQDLLMKPEAFSLGGGMPQAPTQKADKKEELSAEEKEVARRFGMSEEDYVQYRGETPQTSDDNQTRQNMLS